MSEGKPGRPVESDEATTDRLIKAFAALLREGCSKNEHLGVCYVVGLIGPVDPETEEQPFLFQSNAASLSVASKLMAKMLDEAALMEEDPRILDPNMTTH